MDYISGRHPAMLELIADIVPDALHKDRLNVEEVKAGDRVFGTLPFNLAASVCAKGAQFYALVFDQSGLSGGEELTAEDLRARNARLVRYDVEAQNHYSN